MRGAVARLAAVVTGVGVALWLAPASLHIVSWPAASPVRVALLQPLIRLAASLAWTAAAVVAIGAVAALRGRGALRRAASVLSPLMLLWIWAVPYLPWLPDRAPLLLALAGPLRLGIAALAVAGVLAAYWPPQPRAGAGPLGDVLGGDMRERNGRWPRPTVFAVSLGAYLVFGLSSASAIGPGADEPHYLVITHSLLVDHDLDIENNHARRDYRDFFGGELRPDYLQRGRHGEIYSIHAPGLPALLLPSYAIAGYRGAVVFLCVLAALTALAIFDLAERLAGRVPALTTWAAVCLTVPFIPHAWLIYPEMPGALVLAWSLLWLWNPIPEGAAPWLLRGAALAVLPWLHTKFIVLLAALAAFLAVRIWTGDGPPDLRARAGAIAALLAAPALSVASWLWSFYLMYGVLDPEAPYGSYAQTFVRSANIPRGLLGLLVDQKFGLLAYAPVYIFAVVGIWRMLRDPAQRMFATALVLAAASFVGSSTRLYMWWGGSSAPARFLVPILPLLAPMIAVAARNALGVVLRAAFALLLAVSLVIACAAALAPDRLLLFSAPHGYARLAEYIQGASPLALMLPTFTDENWTAPLRATVPWLAAAAIAVAAAAAVSRVRPHMRSAGAAALLCIVFVFAASVLAGTPSASARFATANRGQLELMEDYDGSRLRGFDYSRMKKLDDAGLLAMATVVTRRVETDATDPRRLVGPFELPPGSYLSRLWFAGGRELDGDAMVMLGNRGDQTLARAGAPLGDPVELPFQLVVDTGLWVGVSNAATAAAVRRLEIVPSRLVPRSERPDVEPRALEPIGGWPGAFIVYVDDNTFPEGGVFWTRGTATGRVLVAPSTASAMVLTLAMGPAGGTVALHAAGRSLEETVAPRQIRQISIPVPAGTRPIPVDVTATAAFRPADVDRESADVRLLGVQVRVELK